MPLEPALDEVTAFGGGVIALNQEVTGLKLFGTYEDDILIAGKVREDMTASEYEATYRESIIGQLRRMQAVEEVNNSTETVEVNYNLSSVISFQIYRGDKYAASVEKLEFEVEVHMIKGSYISFSLDF